MTVKIINYINQMIKPWNISVLIGINVAREISLPHLASVPLVWRRLELERPICAEHRVQQPPRQGHTRLGIADALARVQSLHQRLQTRSDRWPRLVEVDDRHGHRVVEQLE